MLDMIQTYSLVYNTYPADKIEDRFYDREFVGCYKRLITAILPLGLTRGHDARGDREECMTGVQSLFDGYHGLPCGEGACLEEDRSIAVGRARKTIAVEPNLDDGCGHRLDQPRS